MIILITFSDYDTCNGNFILLRELLLFYDVQSMYLINILKKPN